MGRIIKVAHVVADERGTGNNVAALTREASGRYDSSGEVGWHTNELRGGSAAEVEGSAGQGPATEAASSALTAASEHSFESPSGKARALESAEKLWQQIANKRGRKGSRQVSPQRRNFQRSNRKWPAFGSGKTN